jgi:hypothetical protein
MAKQDKKTGLYKTEHTDDDLYRLVGLTAPVARPANPRKMTMVGFDASSAAIATKEKLPAPPTARAIQMRFKKPWRDVVDAAITAVATNSVAQAVAATKKADEWLDLDEAHIFYGMQRVAEFLKLDTLSELGYDAGRADLIESVSQAEAALLEEILPKSWQIKRVANDHWEEALALVGMKPERRQFEAHPMLKLVWHFYETKSRFPSDRTLREYANNELGLAMPRGRDRMFSEYIDELKASRAERGWSTPDDGPPERERLSELELAALLEGAPRRQVRGGWTEEKIEEAFVAYVSEYLGKVDLRLRHYQSVRAKHRWPSNEAYSRYRTFGRWIERAKQIVASAGPATKAA